MGEIKDRFMRMVRANLNDMLDRVAEFEDQGGFKTVLDDVLEGRRPDIGAPPSDEEVDPKDWEPPRSEDEKTIHDYYANLEVPYGADKQTVKESYRRLMKKYHPDRFSESPEMQKLATKLSQELTRAYREVLDHIDSQ
ncbi:MAG: DnaJ family molecular chaperone [Bradymonadaceae bacterium]